MLVDSMQLLSQIREIGKLPLSEFISRYFSYGNSIIEALETLQREDLVKFIGSDKDLKELSHYFKSFSNLPDDRKTMEHFYQEFGTKNLFISITQRGLR